ncbi:MAG: Mfa1 family fimbria major subunit [Muribaculaceae bacterium]|nr:Mfa1 family fimbria major subunit [Muribaculaceae bacterium]
MKKIYGFAFASAAMMLASCSSDEPVNNSPVLENDGYLALTIATNGNGTRAGVSDSFTDGKNEENEAKTATVLLFDKDGNQTQAPAKVTLGDWDEVTDVAGVKQETTLTVEKSGAVPTQIMVILNAPATADYTGKNLTAMQSVSADYATTGAAGTFVMSNAQYVGCDGAATAVPQDAIQPTVDLAKEKAVTVYVERVNARLDVAKKDGLQAELPKITMQDGKEKTLDLTIEGIGVAYSAAKSNLIKNMGTINTIFDDAAHFRYDWTVTNLTWNKTQDATTSLYGDFNMFTWKEYKENGLNSWYLQENTGATEQTQLMLAATLTLDGQPFSFAKLAGVYYAEDDALTQLGAMLYNQGYTLVDGASLTSNELEWVSPEERAEVITNNRYTTFAKVKSGVVLKDKGVSEANDVLKGSLYQVKLWKGGATYYYIPIEHFEKDGTIYNGVVRNVIYDYTINSIKGLGTPVNYPGEEDIIPEEPNDGDKFYVGATVKTLKWKVVKKPANFGPQD